MEELIKKVAAYSPPLAIFLSALVVIVGVGWVLWTYTTSAWIEARKPFLQKQLEFSAEATQAAAQIATTTDSKAFDQAKAAFLELFWGRLAMVEDRGLEGAMISFRAALPRYRVDSDRRELEQLSLQIAYASRRMIESNWNIGLGPLSGMKGSN